MCKLYRGGSPCVSSIEIWKSVKVHMGMINIALLYLATSVVVLYSVLVVIHVCIIIIILECILVYTSS